MSTSMPDEHRLRVLSGTAHLRERPEAWFRRGTFNAPEMLSLLVDEAVLHGGDDVRIHSRDPWWAVSSSVDWLDGAGDVFERLTPDPLSGPNSIYVEALLTAWCPHVVTTSGHGVRWVRGSEDPSVLAVLPVGRRAVGFVEPAERARPASRRLSVVPDLESSVAGLAAKESRFRGAAT